MKTELIEKAYAIARERYAEIGVDTEKSARGASEHLALAPLLAGGRRDGLRKPGRRPHGRHPGYGQLPGQSPQHRRAACRHPQGQVVHSRYAPPEPARDLRRVRRRDGRPRPGGAPAFPGLDRVGERARHEARLQLDVVLAPQERRSLAGQPRPRNPGLLGGTHQALPRHCRRDGQGAGRPPIMNLWVHDGSKDLTVNRMLYRELLRDSLDRIFETEYDHMKDCIESKVFGIGLESYTVGSNDFYIGYGASRGKIVTLDTGHFHPTEIVADKISSLLLFIPEVMLHVSRPVRWDSDHVTIMNDDTLELCKEIVRCDALDRVHIGLDYFDASINRIGAYVIGSRATQKCLMQALLEPLAQLRRYEAAGQGFERLALLEESKSLPWNAVWDMFCLRNDVPVGEEFIAGIQQYEREVTSKR